MARTQQGENLSDLILQVGQQKGDDAPVYALLKQGADPNTRDRSGFTAVQRAAQFDRPDLVRAMLDAGADPNASTLPNNSGITVDNTVLMTAAGRGFAEVVEVLLAGGADVNLRDEHGYNALNGAIYFKHITIVTRLRNAGIDVGLMEAGWLGDTDLLETLLAESEAAKSDTAEDALCGAATMGHENAVRLLLQAGVTPNASEAKNRNLSALMRAAQEGHLEIARLLLDAGADVNQAKPSEATALCSAVESIRRLSLAIVELLLERGANPNPPTHNGWTPLMMVATTDKIDTAELLLRHGANPNAFTDKKASADEGCTTTCALMLSIGNVRLEMVKILLRNGANPDAANSANRTPRDVARYRMERPCPWKEREQDRPKIWELLQTAPPLVQTPNADSDTIKQ